MNTVNPLFHRSELLLGHEAMQRIHDTRVIIFGVGGVGSWCAEALVREGIGHLTLVDADDVCITNCNRQLMATASTIGEPKVEALRRRLLDVNPEADITAIKCRYSEQTAETFHLATYDYVIDAIDSLRDKISLVLRTTAIAAERRQSGQDASQQGQEPGPVLFSSMGAALRIDPTKVAVSEFWRVTGDRLAAAMRSAMRRQGTFPARKFLCVHSLEPPLPNLGTAAGAEPSSGKGGPNGSLAHVTGIFGLTLAGLVIEHLTGRR